MRFDIVQGDLEPPIGMTLTGVDSLAGATAEFVMAQADGTKRVQAAATIDDPAARTVHYAWQPGDTDIPGVYRAQMQVVYASGHETFPSDEPFYIVIHPRL